jgi:hypothetical protein
MVVVLPRAGLMADARVEGLGFAEVGIAQPDAVARAAGAAG